MQEELCPSQAALALEKLLLAFSGLNIYGGPLSCGGIIKARFGFYCLKQVAIALGKSIAQLSLIINLLVKQLLNYSLTV